MSRTKGSDKAFFRVCIVVTALLSLAAVVFAAGDITKYAANLIESRGIATVNNVPKTWSTEKSDQISADVSVDSREVEGEYVQYLVSVRNNAADNGFYVTNLAAYLSESGNEQNGFLNLDDESLEYTYDPTDVDSWQEIFITRPSNGENAFRLGDKLFVGWAGSEQDTLYFRFYVAPRSDDAEISSKVSFLVETAFGETGFINESNTIAYHYEAAPSVSNEQVAVVDSDEDYTAPLGVFSISPDAFVLFGTVNSDYSGKAADFNPIWIVFAAISVLLVAFLAYIPLSQRKK